MSQLLPALTAALEGKNAELKQHHLAARIGDLQGSRVQAVRDVLDGWATEEGTPLHALWTQVRQATDLHTEEIERIRAEAHRAIPGVTDPECRSGEDG